MKKNSTCQIIVDETGVALVTVVMISVLLLIACIAILTAVGSHSKNVTDVLSESKAYYAAESGIQATINVLRGNTDLTPNVETDDIDYKKAVKTATSNYAGDPTSFARLSAWLNYNYAPTSGGVPDRVVIGEAPETYSPKTGTAYKVEVSDPDNTQDYITFSTVGNFTDAAGVGTGASTSIPTDVAASNRTTLQIGVVTNSSIIFATNTQNVPIASFIATHVAGTGAADISAPFRVDLAYSAPRQVTRSLRGKFLRTSGGAVSVSIDSAEYLMAGSTVSLCNSPVDTVCNTRTLALTPGTAVTVYARMTPVEPYRLKLLATGYGPNNAIKRLEAVIQRNFFNELASSAAVANIGPHTGSTFEPGNSNRVTYTGADQGGGVIIPAIGFTDPNSVTALNDLRTNANISPAPALLGDDLPDWQRSPEALDTVVRQLRISAQNSVRYFPSGVQPATFGNFTNGTGLTFCDGDCDFTGEGGGILISTGKLTFRGNFSFKGLIIVTGAGGIDRNGGGQGNIIGNIVVAPYNPANLAAGFLPPQYDMSGGGGSEVQYSSTASINFDGQTAVSDFMQGVSEK